MQQPARFVWAGLLVVWGLLQSGAPTTVAAPAAFPNGGFEIDANSDGKPDSWDWPATNWVWDGSVAHSGSRSAKISRFSGGATPYLWSANVPVQPSTNYTLTYWMRTQNASKRPRVVLFQYDTNGAQTGSRMVLYVSVSGTTGWQQITIRFQTTPDAANVRLRLHLNSGVTGTFWFDDFNLVSNGAALYPIRTGFPLEMDNWADVSAPAVADVDNDGQRELLAADYTGKIHVWNAAGAYRSGFPLVIGGNIIGHLVLADLNNNGDLEIIAGIGSQVKGAQGHVYAWRPDGSLLPGWPQAVARYGSQFPSQIPTIAVADVDGDGDPEVIAGTNNNNLTTNFTPYVPNLYVWHHTGAMAAGWPVEDSNDAAVLGTLAVGNFRSSGEVAIVTGRDYHRLFAYDAQGNDLPGWPRYTFVPENGVWNVDPRIVHRYSAPVLADLDGDGTVEYIVAGQRRPANSATIYNVDLLVLEPDGTRRPGWETPAGGMGVLDTNIWMQQAPAVADLTGDGRLEIVWPAQDGYLHVYSADKTLLWRFNYAQGAFVYASEPAIGDVDDDGRYEILFGTYDPLHGATGTVGLWILEDDGTPKAGSPLAVGSPGIMAAPTLTDLDGDGRLDIVAVTTVGYVYVWETSFPYRPAHFPWPMARHDLQRTAFYVNTAPDLSASEKMVNVGMARQGDMVNFTIRLLRAGSPLTDTVELTDTIPAGLVYLTGTLTATSGTWSDANPASLQWSGVLSDTAMVEIHYQARVTTALPRYLENTATVQAGSAGVLTLSAGLVVNGKNFYLPLLRK